MKVDDADKERRMMKSVIMLAGLLLSGCSSVPRELVYEPENQLVAYQPALQGMGGKNARWSGVISAVHNEQDQSVVGGGHLPLKANGVADPDRAEPGRFLAVSEGLCRSDALRQGRSLTVLGTWTSRWTAR